MASPTAGTIPTESALPSFSTLTGGGKLPGPTPGEINAGLPTPTENLSAKYSGALSIGGPQNVVGNFSFNASLGSGSISDGKMTVDRNMGMKFDATGGTGSIDAHKGFSVGDFTVTNKNALFPTGGNPYMEDGKFTNGDANVDGKWGVRVAPNNTPHSGEFSGKKQ